MVKELSKWGCQDLKRGRLSSLSSQTLQNNTAASEDKDI